MVDVLSSQLPSDYRESWLAFWADGGSMAAWGIGDGDLVLYDPTCTDYEGRVVVAVVNGASTVKRYRRQGQTIVLMPSTADYEPIVVTERDEFQVCGVVRYSLAPARAVT